VQLRYAPLFLVPRLQRQCNRLVISVCRLRLSIAPTFNDGVYNGWREKCEPDQARNAAFQQCIAWGNLAREAYSIRDDFLEPPSRTRHRVEQRRISFPRQLRLTLEHESQFNTTAFIFTHTRWVTRNLGLDSSPTFDDDILSPARMPPAVIRTLSVISVRVSAPSVPWF
jgi:hypothetical protein